MPCTNEAHSHDWVTAGTLSIEKCEMRCGFCSSTKNYKPASALRKHVATHIRNDHMPLTLEHSRGGRPKIQTISAIPEVSSPPHTLETTLETYNAKTISGGSPTIQESESRTSLVVQQSNECLACWRCTILNLKCNMNLPCNGCLSQEPPCICRRERLEQFLPLILWNEFEFPQTLHWSDNRNLSLDIAFTEYEVPDVEQRGWYRQHRRLIPRLGFECLALCLPPSESNYAMSDPHQTITLIEGFVRSRLNTVEINPRMNALSLGLTCLKDSLEIFRTTRTIFEDYQLDHHDQNIIFVVSYDKSYWDSMKPELGKFLRGLHDQNVIDRSEIKIGRLLQAYYQIVLLFLIRCTWRSTLRYAKSGFAAFGHQANQDHSFDMGLRCTLYQPMLFVLGSSQLTFRQILRDPFSSTDLPKQFVEAVSLISVPNPMDKTPLEHIVLFFERFFPSQGRNAIMALRSGNADGIPSAQLDSTSTNVGPSTHLQLPG